MSSDDGADENLWNSPVPEQARTKQGRATTTKSANGSYGDQTARDAELQQELAGVRKVNEAIEGVIDSLERAKGSMKTVNQTVNAASTLLDTWSRILSQTEHNQRLILNPSWQGASQDLEDMERETITKKQTEQRREAEEQERRAAVARKAEEEDRRRAEAATRVTRSSGRGRTGSGAKGASSTRPASAGYVASGGTGNTSASSASRGSSTATRRGSGISRGTGYRGRGRA